MSSYPLEIELEELDKEKVEKEEMEKKNIKEDADTTSNDNKEKTPYIQPIPIIIGSIICIMAIINMTVLVYIPYHRIQTNKKKFPDAKFEKPSKLIIISHFIIHPMVFSCGCLLVLSGFRRYKTIDHEKVWCFLISMAIITLLIFIFVSMINYIETCDIYPKTTIDELTYLLSRKPPIDCAFIYSECVEFNYLKKPL